MKEYGRGTKTGPEEDLVDHCGGCWGESLGQRPEPIAEVGAGSVWPIMPESKRVILACDESSF